MSKKLKEPHYQLKLFSSEKQSAEVPIDHEFSVDFADSLARLESYNKHLYRPNTYLHKWWARRCGSTFRLILKHLVAEETQRNYYAPGGLEGKVILDPMMGGGTTLHEAIRLGANVIGADIDPIPVLQARATLSEISPRRLDAAFSEFFHGLKAELESFYETSCPSCEQSVVLQYTLYAVRRYCQCGSFLFLDSYTLRYNSDGSVFHIDPLEHHILLDERVFSAAQIKNKLPILEKKEKGCSKCGEKYLENRQLPYFQRYEPVAIVAECPEHGLFFTPLGAKDYEAIFQANELRDKIEFDSDFTVESGPKSDDLIRRGIESYLDLFSSRQLLYLSKSQELLSSFEPLVRLNLALLVSTSLEFNSMLCGYKGGAKSRPGAIRHTFSHHAYSFPYTALENNPVYPGKTSGTLRNLFHRRIRRARKWALNPVERMIENGKVRKVNIDGELDVGIEVQHSSDLESETHRFLLVQGSSASLNIPDDSIDFVVTDPPYFDSVQYSDLAAFFRVWLRVLLSTDAKWNYEHSNSAVDPHANGNGQYRGILGQIFSECHRALRKNGRLIFTYHHWNPKAWSALTAALKKAGFVLVNHYIVHSENPVSVHIANFNSLTHDAILVFAPSKADVQRMWNPPETIDDSDSKQFTEDCAATLGWLLSNDFTEKDIDQEWECRIGSQE